MELSDYLRILRTHWRGVLLIVVATLIAAGVFTMSQTKVYSANASGFVATGVASNPALGSVNDQLAKSRATSYVDIATSRATAQQVIDDLGLHADPASLVSNISVVQPTDTVLLQITAKAGTPREAQRLADAWVRALAAQVQTIEDPNGTHADGVPKVIPIDSAELPGSPISPKPRRNLAIALVLGLLLGLGYSMVRNTLDRRLRSPAVVEQLFDVPVVGNIPVARFLRHDPKERAHLVVDRGGAPDDGHRAAAEAFGKMRTNLTYMRVDDPPRVIVVTSPSVGDGKSTVAMNLSASLAYNGQSVVLIDADLRRPSVAKGLGLVNDVGLTTVLAGRIAVDDAFQVPAGRLSLRVLAAGPLPPNPSELLGTKLMQDMVGGLAQTSVVVIDAPPLLPVTDAAVLAAWADGAFVVITAGRTKDTDLKAALDHLRSVNGEPLGVVFNQAKPGTGGYRYDDEYYYLPTQWTGPPQPASQESNA